MFSDPVIYGADIVVSESLDDHEEHGTTDR